jgi:hypothetical protein
MYGLLGADVEFFPFERQFDLVRGLPRFVQGPRAEFSQVRLDFDPVTTDLAEHNTAVESVCDSGVYHSSAEDCVQDVSCIATYLTTTPFPSSTQSIGSMV